MFQRSILVVLVLFLGIVGLQASGPANVIRGDGTCSVGWFGCSSDVGVMLPDGSWTCPASAIGLVFVEGDWMSVDTNSEPGIESARCKTTIEFGQPNPAGVLGGGGDVIALSKETVCTFLPDACQGNGAFVANPRTIGSLAVCLMNGRPTTDMQETVTPSGRASLVCSLRDD